jgi:hypothetical protein
MLGGVYTLVSSILWLTAISRGTIERMYFDFCTTSASFGLRRQLLGDPAIHVAVDVAMLACAVVTGVWMLGLRPQGLERIDVGSAARR